MDIYHDQKIAFFISTNEEYDTATFSGLPLADLHFPSAAHDLLAISLCDRIIGPLSTFSRWASFIGRVPLCFLEKGLELKRDDDFSIIASLYRFENGKEIINLSDK